LAFFILLLANRLRKTSLSSFTYMPLFIVSQIVTAITFLGSFYVLATGISVITRNPGSWWLGELTMIIGAIFYIMNAYWSRNEIFTYASLFSIFAIATSTLIIAQASELVFAIIYVIMAFAIFLLAKILKGTELSSFTYMPLTIVSNIVVPITFLGSFVILASGEWIFTNNPGVIWLAEVTMTIGAIFYILNAYWRRNEIFTYASLFTFGCIVLGLLIHIEAALMVYPLVFAVLALVFLVLSFYLQNTSISDFTSRPFLVSAQLIIPIVVALGFVGWFSDMFIRDSGNPWIAISVLMLGVGFYVLTDVLYKWLAVRWVAAVLFPITFTIILIELNFSDSAIAMSLMVLALIYLGVGYLVQQRDARKYAGWPMFAVSYGLALLVTTLAIPEDTSGLVKVLFGDVVLLAVSAAIHRSYLWVYGSVWLFMLPIYMTISLFVPKIQYQGLLMGVLGLNYLAAGYILGRKELRLGGPFLTAAVFLSAIIVGMTWIDPLIASIMLVVGFVIYILAALWLGWTWLLFPSLLAVNLAVLTINSLVFNYQYQDPFWRSLIISYFSLGVVITLCARGLRRFKLERWSWPLSIVGAIDLAGAYLVSFVFGGWLVVSISTVFAIMLLAFSWLERKFIETKMKIPVLTYLAIGVIFVGHFFALYAIGGERLMSVWPAYTAGMCAIFVGLAWILRGEPWKEIYAGPLRYSGLWLMIVPCGGSLVYMALTGSFEPILVAVTFGIAGITYTSDAALRKILKLAYLGLGTFLVVFWAVLFALGIDEPQAFVIPLGIAILGVGWNERVRKGMNLYRVLSMMGLVLLMGSALVQSLTTGNFWYAVLLALESLVSIIWGVATHSRCFVQFGGIALIANAIIQLGPGFIDLPRWVHIGVTGGLLLAIGLIAMFKREDILETRSKMTEEWRQWAP